MIMAINVQIDIILLKIEHRERYPEKLCCQGLRNLIMVVFQRKWHYLKDWKELLYQLVSAPMESSTCDGMVSHHNLPFCARFFQS